jgi:3-oxoacyl-[acyl-carrier-protein] synthase-1
MARQRVVITGTGAVCAAGRDTSTILETVRAGRSAIGPIQQWDASQWPRRLAGEVPNFNARELVEDRKLHKLIRRTDLFGLYAASRAVHACGFAKHRDALQSAEAAEYSDRTGVYVGSGGGNYDSQYDYFPLLTEAHDELPAFGRELANTVNPMWLLRTLPNNVLGHIGIRHGFKGANACITNHSIGGTLAVIEASEALRNGECDRALAVGHDAPIEPQMVLYYHDVGLLATEAIRPFDARRDGSLFGEGAAALALETEASARERGAMILGDVLGGGAASDAQGLLAIRDDGDALARAIELALAEAGIEPRDVGMIAAHGNGTPQSDASEAAAIRRVFGDATPPATAFKWAFGHLIAAAGILEAVLALDALREGRIPGVATYAEADPDCRGARISREMQKPESDVALVLCRGFAGTNAALLLRAARVN